MASSALTAPNEESRLGWEWAPPPPPKQSTLRRQEPVWQEPPVLPSASRPRNQEQRTRAWWEIGLGTFFFFLIGASGWFFLLSMALLAVGGLELYKSAQSPTGVSTEVARRNEHWDAFCSRHRAWLQAVEREEQDNRERHAVAPRWYPIRRLDPSRRLDVFGGSSEGWASLIHTAFGPWVNARSITVLDLTQHDLARRALWPEAAPGEGPLRVALPSDLRRYDPLVGATHPVEIAANLLSVEGPHEDWTRRDMEMGVLRHVAGALSEPVTLPRMLAGVTSLVAPDAPLVSAQLSPDERRALLDPHFLVMLGGEAATHVSRITVALEAVVGPPRLLAEPADAKTAPLPFFDLGTCLIAADRSSAQPASRRRVDNLLAAELVDRLFRLRQTEERLLLVIGADRLSRENLEGLITGAQENGLRLSLFFEHLRGESRELLGRGAAETIIMSLGNHEDASADANFIGKEHRFVVSSITKTVGSQLGGSDTHGFSVSDSNSYAHTSSVGPDSSTSTSGRTVGASFNYAKTWAETENYGETATRSEEFLARAEDIQRIPTTGFIYATAVSGRQHVIFGDCHPAIERTSLMAAKPIARR